MLLLDLTKKPTPKGANRYTWPVARKIPLESMQLTLKERDSTASFITRDLTGIQINSWLQDDTDPGNTAVWRVRSIEQGYSTGTHKVTLEHAINTLRDRIIWGEVKPADMINEVEKPKTSSTAETCSALTAITYILGGQVDWILSSSWEYGNVYGAYSFDGDDLYSALESVTETLEDAEWKMDTSSYPFMLEIRKQKSGVACEVRPGRNMRAISKTVDRSGMYTRIFPTGKDDLQLGNGTREQAYVEDVNHPERLEQYGVIEKAETNSSLEKDYELHDWAMNKLHFNNEPVTTLTVDALELSNATGEPMDKFKLGRICRVPLSYFLGGNTTDDNCIAERIIELSYPDKIGTPELCKVTMSNSKTDVTTLIANIAKTASSGTKANGRTSKAVNNVKAIVLDTVKDVKITGPVNNTYTLKYLLVRGDKDKDTDWKSGGTFSRAVTSWTVSATGGTITVTAKPQEQSKAVYVQAGTASIPDPSGAPNVYKGQIQYRYKNSSGNWVTWSATGAEYTVNATERYNAGWNTCRTRTIDNMPVALGDFATAGSISFKIPKENGSTGFNTHTYTASLTTYHPGQGSTANYKCIELTKSNEVFLRFDINTEWTAQYNSGWNTCRTRTNNNLPVALGDYATADSISFKVPQANGSSSFDTHTYSASLTTYHPGQGSTANYKCIELTKSNEVFLRFDINTEWTAQYNSGWNTCRTRTNNNLPTAIGEYDTNSSIAFKVPRADGSSSFDTYTYSASMTTFHPGQGSTAIYKCVELTKSNEVFMRFDIHEEWGDEFNAGWNSCRTRTINNMPVALGDYDTGSSISFMIPQADGSASFNTHTYSASLNTYHPGQGVTTTKKCVELTKSNEVFLRYDIDTEWKAQYYDGWNTCRSRTNDNLPTVLGDYDTGSSISFMVPKADGSSSFNTYTYSASLNTYHPGQGVTTTKKCVELTRSSEVFLRFDIDTEWKAQYNDGWNTCRSRTNDNLPTALGDYATGSSISFMVPKADGSSSFNTYTYSASLNTYHPGQGVTTTKKCVELTRSSEVFLRFDIDTEWKAQYNDGWNTCRSRTNDNLPTALGDYATGSSISFMVPKADGSSSFNTYTYSASLTTYHPGQGVTTTKKCIELTRSSEVFLRFDIDTEWKAQYNDGWNACRTRTNNNLPVALGDYDTANSISFKVPKADGSSNFDTHTYSASLTSYHPGQGVTTSYKCIELSKSGSVYMRYNINTEWTQQFNEGRKAATVTLSYGDVHTDSVYQKYVTFKATNNQNTSRYDDMTLYLVKSGNKAQLRKNAANGTIIMEINT